MNFSFFDIVKAFYEALTMSKKELVGYDVVPLPYTMSGTVQLMRPCNGWTVINKGTTNVTVNGAIVLAPDEFIAISGNEREEYTGFLRLTFASNADPGNNAIVFQKFYQPGGPLYDKIGV